MDKEVINLIMQFLKRVDLKGQEVPAFNKATNSLMEEFNRQDSPEETPETKEE